MGGMDNRLCLIINIICSIIAINYMEQGFARKYKGWKGSICMVAGCIIYFLTVTLSNNFIMFEGIFGLIYILLLIFYGCIALKGNLVEKVLMGVLWGIIILFCSYAMFSILRIITGLHINRLSKTDGDVREYFVLATTIMEFIVGRLVLIVKKNIKGVVYELEEWVIIGSLLMIFVLVIGIFTLEHQFLNSRARYYLSLGLISGFIFIIICFGYFYRKLERCNREKQEVEYERMRLEQQIENFKNLESMSKEIRMIKHDMKGKMDILYCLITNGNNKDALKYIEETSGRIKEIGNCMLETNNFGFDAALMKVVNETREKGINFKYTVLAKVSCFDNMDIGILFYNLFSNAVEACQEINGEKIIELILFESKGELVCNLHNSIKETVLGKNPDLKTSKKNKNVHGYGMKSIYNIIQKYDGEYICMEENMVFIQEFNMKYPKVRK